MRETVSWYGPSYSYANTIVFNNFPWPNLHEANDKAVLKAYGLKPNATEEEIVQHLFEMYEKLTSN